MRPRSGSRALGAIAAQGSQAFASFTLQFAAARFLGLDGLGKFAVLYGFIVFATAVCSGFVGDSLTVLDRRSTPIRAGLQWWLAVLAVGFAAVCSGGAALSGFLSPAEAIAFGVSTLTFVIEDVIRRLLMAGLQFWRIVILDLAAAVVALTVLIVAGASGRLDLTALLVALSAGQVAAVLTGWRLLPPDDRILAPMLAPAVGAVAAYGSWRALQQAVRAGTLALVRVICLLVVGERAVGELEAARIYMAPVVLAVAGASSYLFAAYALSAAVPLERLVARADRAVVQLTVGVLAVGVVAVVATPLLGSVLTGGEYELSTVSVAGWGAFAISIAAATPYAQLASVRGREVAVFTWRLADSVCSLIATYAVVSITRSVEWLPLLLAASPVLGGVAIRTLVLQRDLAATDARAGVQR